MNTRPDRKWFRRTKKPGEAGSFISSHSRTKQRPRSFTSPQMERSCGMCINRKPGCLGIFGYGRGGGNRNELPKVQDESFHPPLKHGETIMIRFSQSFCQGPLVVLDAITGDDSSRPVAAMAAMNENGAGKRLDQPQN